MKIYPLEDYSSIVFKLEKGYVTHGIFYVELINIDSSNDQFQFYIQSEYIISSISIPHGNYKDFSEIFPTISEGMKLYGITVSYSNGKLFTDILFGIISNNFSELIGLKNTDIFNTSSVYYITRPKIFSPTEFYILVTTSPESIDNSSMNAIKTITSLQDNSINSISINFQNNYENLYLLISSNLNKYPLKYNELSYLEISV